MSPAIAITEPKVTPGLFDCFSGPQTVAMDARGNFVVVWKDGSIWGRRFDRAGNPLGERFRIGSPGATSGRVALAMAPSGEFIVARRAPVKPDVMLLSRFTPDGRQTGSMARLAYRGFDPAIALDRSGRVALFWTDGRRPALALFDASLKLLGPVIFDPPGRHYQEWDVAEDNSPVGVAFGDDGRILTVWVGPRSRRAADSILGRFWKVQ